MRPVSNELHLWCSVPWTVMMHKTSNNHWFTFAFNYCLAHAACVCMCVCESVGARPTECTHRAEVLPPWLVHCNTTANHKVTSATSTGTKGQIWSWTYFQSSSVPVDCSLCLVNLWGSHVILTYALTLCAFAMACLISHFWIFSFTSWFNCCSLSGFSFL